MNNTEIGVEDLKVKTIVVMLTYSSQLTMAIKKSDKLSQTQATTELETLSHPFIATIQQVPKTKQVIITIF